VARAHASLQQILNRLYDQSDSRQAAIDAMLRAGALHAVTAQEYGKMMPYRKQWHSPHWHSKAVQSILSMRGGPPSRPSRMHEIMAGGSALLSTALDSSRKDRYNGLPAIVSLLSMEEHEGLYGLLGTHIRAM
jgi:hypothetical protein